MFTGIIEDVGHIESLTPTGDDIRLRIRVNKLDMSDVALGDSIANNGVCLTVVDMSASGFSADVSHETIKRSGFADYKAGSKVNLEKAMLPSSRFGGHIVSGHVDGVGEVISINPVGRYVEIWVQAPNDLARYLAEKGSITVDGVSLTVNAVDGAKFLITLIPHSLQETIIGGYKKGTKINLEVDVVARYLERLMLGDKAAQSGQQKSDISMAFLAENGYLR
ncbi:riboflavin synthase [Paraglaciecola chathamensis]|uniref:Riboflavin synthase n=3 Tax=Paraglaciecola chathamensis TaxID=368405 RepID=A0A8H9IAV1_9ALTE|nr:MULTISPECIES: riboflavin synthase [Paraglaciecola]MBJ2134853.1 riboflavin synthase [Paraglaciecola chathamensis]GAC06153.1 riboflavin synthase [Paraglaciecola agarilytica NO2]GAC10675.1 riboflavin synthase [Paraglaciecola chathamensis S18K6]GGZ64852.1 riboflavin synthase subunit alpha [Paraglaciecola oceanifecundans]